jgi:hypothetical protein
MFHDDVSAVLLVSVSSQKVQFFQEFLLVFEYKKLMFFKKSQSYTLVFCYFQTLVISGIFSLACTISISTVSIGSSTTFLRMENILGLSKSLVQSGQA